MPLFPEAGTSPDTASAVGAPIRLRSPAGPWRRILEALHERGAVMVYAVLDDWVPADLDDPALEAILGRDWPRYRAMTHEQVRARFAASRRLLKHVAAKVINSTPQAVELAVKLGGRPYLRGCDQIDISLSHTEDLLLVGVTRLGWIGVDAEATSRMMSATGIERQICTPYEREMLATVDAADRNTEMVRLWTLKEAYSKAIGQGLRFRFNEFGFGPSGRPVKVQRPDGSVGTGQEWSFGTYQVEERFTVSWALYDAGFGDTEDIAVATMLDEGLLEALIALGGSGVEVAA